jgi:hypothetical protein
MNVYGSVHDVISVYEKQTTFTGSDDIVRTYRTYTFITGDGGQVEVTAFISDSFLEVKKGLAVGEIENAPN